MAQSDDVPAPNDILELPPNGRGGGVLVVHDWPGRSPSTEETCQRLAREGFVALAPDLFGGCVPGDPAEALAWTQSRESVHSALADGVTALLNHVAVDGARVAALGYGLGGRLALEASTRDPRIAAVVDLYGMHGDPLAGLDRSNAAVLGIFAEDDVHTPQPAVEKLEAALRDAGVRAAIDVVAGVEHGFLDEARPDVFEPDAATRAWAKLVGFLHAQLG